MCGSLGHRLAPASAAIRANMDRFVQSEFTAHSGQAVRVARMPSNDQWRRGRLALWIAMAVRDCRLADAERRPASQAAPELQRCAMGILLAEASRTDVADWVDHLHQINIEVDGRHELISDIERDALHCEVGRSQGQLASQYEHDPQGRLLKHRAFADGSCALPGCWQASGSAAS
ncbi:hypothetical protein [Pelomonas sp. BJYL3]|uniref:hypothetical protein n=1 Tax=Pelomonas sp. BJYL3 TaxID=2976697 RepID=UPI0022B486E0|nr:hypothetical protein [Pelomonas sp. BJYL3]